MKREVVRVEPLSTYLAELEGAHVGRHPQPRHWRAAHDSPQPFPHGCTHFAHHLGVTGWKLRYAAVSNFPVEMPLSNAP